MKREESQLVKIEDFYRRCLQARFAGRAVAVVRREKGADSLGSDQGTIKCNYRTLSPPGGVWSSSSAPLRSLRYLRSRTEKSDLFNGH